MSWKIINTNPKNEMFRLDELQEQNENIYITEEELEIIEQLIKKGYIDTTGDI